MSAATAEQFFISDATKSKVNEIKRVVAEKYGVTPEQIDSRAKPKTLALARHVAMWLARKGVKTAQPYRDGFFPLSYPDIAHLFKREDHGSAMHAVRRVEALRERDVSFRVQTNDLLLKFGVYQMTGKEESNDAKFVVRVSDKEVAP